MLFFPGLALTWFSGRVGEPYLQKYFASMIQKIIGDATLNLEIDPRYAQKAGAWLNRRSSHVSWSERPGSLTLSVLKDHKRKLLHLGNKIFNKIVQPGTMDDMPRELRY
jgi:hypothetical protein